MSFLAVSQDPHLARIDRQIKLDGIGTAADDPSSTNNDYAGPFLSRDVMNRKTKYLFPLAVSMLISLPAAAADSRSHIIEMQLRDLARPSATAPTIANTPIPSDCGLCGQSTLLPQSNPSLAARPTSQDELRGSLHRLRREIREQQPDHGHDHLIEEALSAPMP